MTSESSAVGRDSASPKTDSPTLVPLHPHDDDNQHSQHSQGSARVEERTHDTGKPAHQSLSSSSSSYIQEGKDMKTGDLTTSASCEPEDASGAHDDTQTSRTSSHHAHKVRNERDPGELGKPRIAKDHATGVNHAVSDAQSQDDHEGQGQGQSSHSHPQQSAQSIIGLIHTVQKVAKFEHNRRRSIKTDYDVDEFGAFVGEGAYSKVYRAFHRGTGEKVAVKIPQRLDIGYNHNRTTGLGSVITNQLRELRLMHNMKSKLDCAHLLRLHDIYDNLAEIESGTASHYRMYIVTSYLSGGDLLSRLVNLHRKGIKYSERKAAACFYEICQGIQALHKANIIHRDMKPENLLLDEDEDNDTARIVLGDFGFSVTTNHSTKGRFVGTPHYAAPEVWHSPPIYSKAGDIWSTGVILFVMLSGTHPFWIPNSHHVSKHESRKHLRALITNGIIHMPDCFWKHISESAKDLVKRMLTVDHNARPTIEQVLEHPWLNEMDVEEGVELSDTVQRLGEFNAGRTLRASAWAVAWSRRITALRAAKLRPLMNSFAIGEETVQRLRVLFEQVARGGDPEAIMKDLNSLSQEALKNASIFGESGPPQKYRTIGRQQFMEIMGLMGFSQSLLERMYDVFDANGDGHLDYTEFLFGLSLLNKKGENTLKACFDILDKDGTGTLTRDEICGLLNASAAVSGFQGIESAEADESDSVDSDDIEEQVDEIEEIFQMLDVNNDDKISYEEFKNGIDQRPELRRLLVEPIVKPAKSLRDSVKSNSASTDNDSQPLGQGPVKRQRVHSE